MLLDNATRRIALKELSVIFSSPLAYLFLASFVGIMLYIFFWVETFFARNVADVRPLFEWMPIILVFLSSALTMRMWSEEHRAGTIEFVMTMPLKASHFVVGKFYACLLLLFIALVLTLPIPVTVSIIADLDWGPVMAGYLAAMLLGAAYLSIGLFVSARSDSQIVSLMLSTLLCGAFYLLGSSLITGFFANQAGEWMRLLGSGSRFESIERGVIDGRDLYYYASITVVFLILNVYSLTKRGWASKSQAQHHNKTRLLTFLLVANVILANVWLYPFNQLRQDVTRGQLYSLSDASKNYLERIREPMLIRGYFSAKTHPLLSPLVPRIKDMLKEYEVEGKGRVRVEFINPQLNPDAENEANKKYGIKPVPLQVSDKYQSSLVNSYFNVLIQYGDEYEVLGFRDLIEVKARGESDIDVQLRNPEYDITRSIKKVLQAYQSGGNIFEQMTNDISITAYISEDQRLPPILKTLKTDVLGLLAKYKSQAGDKLKVDAIAPDAGDGSVAQDILKQYGFKPMSASLLDKNTFYFYVLLESNGQKVQVPLPSDYKIDGFKRDLNAGIKRFASDYLKTIGLVTPPPTSPYMAQLGRSEYDKLKQALSANQTVKKIDLRQGVVPGDVDILLLAAPRDMTEIELFAVDQFIMKGGTAIMATSPYSVDIQENKLRVSKQKSGLESWLGHAGISLAESFIMDPQNAKFPVPVTRNAGGFSFQEIRMLDYPYFPDVRETLNKDNAITADLGQLTMTWSSPIVIDEKINKQRQVTELLSSSSAAWLSTSNDVMPRLRADGGIAFATGADTGSQLMGVIIEGQFDSYFKGKSSPLLSKKEDVKGGDKKTDIYSGVISHSSDAARVILFSSNEFIKDQSVRFLASAQGAAYLNSYQLIANAIDWSLEDRGLLTIRSRGHFNQTLPPMDRKQQQNWEYVNYGFVLFGIILIGMIRRVLIMKKRRQYQVVLSGENV